MRSLFRAAAIAAALLFALPSWAQFKVLSVVPNDDSARITFTAVPGALDYRATIAGYPNQVKYSGGNTTIEVNGLPAKGTTVYIEAVAALGPYIAPSPVNAGSVCPTGTSGLAGTGASTCYCSCILNGQGAPTSRPRILAKCYTWVRPVARTLTGEQAFLERWRDPVTPGPAQPIPGVPSANGTNYQTTFGPIWTAGYYQVDAAKAFSFVDHGHAMTVNYDWARVTNATIVLSPSRTVDWTGKVLHVTWEVDAHNDSRRWTDCALVPADDVVSHPDFFHQLCFPQPNDPPTSSGNCIVQATMHTDNRMIVWRQGAVWGVDPRSDEGKLLYKDGSLRKWWTGAGVDDQGNLLPNGTDQQLDLRHRFDWYISSNRAMLFEEGKLQYDLSFDVPLPITRGRVLWAAQMYHSALDEVECKTYHPEDRFWWTCSVDYDQRHWDNMGFEVIGAFPAR